jgi:hypothetical protein
MRRWTSLILSILLVSQLAGCALLYELQPHRLRRWNRGPAPSIDPEFTTMRSFPAPSTLAPGAEPPPLVVRAQQ